eukprot:8626310-Pyramimonas_sp.AAC.1
MFVIRTRTRPYSARQAGGWHLEPGDFLVSCSELDPFPLERIRRRVHPLLGLRQLGRAEVDVTGHLQVDDKGAAQQEAAATRSQQSAESLDAVSRISSDTACLASSHFPALHRAIPAVGFTLQH